MKRTFYLLLMIMSFVITSTAFSTNVGFMWDAPVRYFTDQDWKYFNAAVDKALNSTPDGKSVYWNNSASGNHGSIQPFNTTKSNGLVCRQIKIESVGDHRTGQAVNKLCKYPTGWKIPSDN